MLMHSSLIVRELECSAFIRSIVLFIVLLYFVISNDRIPNSAESFSVGELFFGGCVSIVLN